MKRANNYLSSLAAILLLMVTMLSARPAAAAPVENETRLAVAVHVSENTRSHGLSLSLESPDYPWRYFQIYTLLEEALIADGTPFVEVSDANIAAGALQTSSGAPKYPILISLAAECISDAEAQAIRAYVSSGGFAYVGGSAWTRKADGSLRPSFALATEMGLNSVKTGVNNWILIGGSGEHIKRVASHLLVNHLPASGTIQWPMPETYYDTMKFYEIGSSAAHYAWNTVATTATPLVTIQDANQPFLAINSLGRGWFIYQAELAPLAGWNEGNVVLLEYTFFRNAIEWAFSARGVPLVRVAAWPWPNQAAFILRHDDVTIPPNWSLLLEEDAQVHGQYYIMTDSVSPSAMPEALANARSHGAVIGSHSRSHIGPDTQSYTSAYNNIHQSLVDLAEWMGVRPTTWVAPFFAAILDSSFQAIADNNLLAGGGDQSVGPFPHYPLSMETEKAHYNFLELPPTFWLNSYNEVLAPNDGAWDSQAIQDAFNHVYDLGGLVSIYDHLKNSASLTRYINYAQTMPWLWKTTSDEIAVWWKEKSAVQFSTRYFTDGAKRTLQITASGATNPLTAFNIVSQNENPVAVTIGGVASSKYRQDGYAVKINSGTAQSIALTWSTTNAPPLAMRDAFSTFRNIPLAIVAPGVLANDTDPDGDTLTAVLVSNPAHGTVTLKPDGLLIYTPASGYTGSDSFTYSASDGTANSSPVTVTLTVAEPLFGLGGGNTVSTEPAGYLEAMRFQNTVSNGQLTKLEILFDSANVPSGKVRLGVYADNNGYPGARLLDAGEVAASNGWASISGLALPVTQGTYYWLAFDLQNANKVRYQTGLPAAGAYYWARYSYGAFPAQYPSGGGTINEQVVMRATVIGDGNIPPLVTNDAYSTRQSKALAVSAPGVLSNDIDANGDTLTAARVSGPAHGTLALNANGSFTYTSAAGYAGNDSFTYCASDGKANSTPATVALTVKANIPPAGVGDTYSGLKDTPLAIAAPGVLANDTDPDGDPLTAVPVSGLAHGTVILNPNGSFTYTPVAGYTGNDSFIYCADDGITASNSVTVALTIAAPQAPTFGLNGGNTVSTEPGSYLEAMRFQNGVGSGQLTKLEILFDSTNVPSGKVRLGVYADNNGYPGARLLDAGEVAVSNGWASISGLNLAVTQGTYYWLAFDLQNANKVRYQTGLPSSGTYYWAHYSYDALPAQYPAGGGTINDQVVMRATVSVGAVGNTPPAAVDDAYRAAKDIPLTIAAPGVLANDTDPEGNPLTAALISGPAHGTVVLNLNGSFTYTPAAGYTGSDAFTYCANDGKDNSGPAMVALAVAAQDPSFGLNDGNTASTEPAGYLEAMRFQNGVGSGQLTRLEILFDSTNVPSGKVRLGVYADNNGYPGARLLDAGEVAATNGWASISGLNLPVVQNSYYWLSFDLQNANKVRYQTGLPSSGTYYWFRYSYGALPAQYPAGGGTINDQVVMRASVRPGLP